MWVFTRLACLAILLTAFPLWGEMPRILLYGESYMDPVSQALERVGIAHERLEQGSPVEREPGSVDALFLAYDAEVDAALVEWIDGMLEAGGKLFTFYQLPPPLQERMGIRLGRYLRPEKPIFARIRTEGSLPQLPDVVQQQSANINLAEPMADSVRVIARWCDAEGKSTGHPALLLSPRGVHMTHVLLGEDVEGAAQLYAALLDHFFPGVWPAAVRGALEKAARVGGGPENLAALVAPVKKGRKDLKKAEEARARGRELLEKGDFSGALAAAFRAHALGERALARGQKSRQGEFRAVWLHYPYGVADWGWEKTCRVLAESGFNAIVPNMLDAGRASYPSRVLPVDPRVNERGDQLAQAVAAAHRHGLAFHAWKVNFNLSSADSAFVNRMRREGRLQRSVDGEEITWLCPSHPENFALEVASLLEVVRNYEVDGLHFDYIRYPHAQGCFDEGCRKRFEAQTGHRVEHWPEEVITGELAEAFQQWRRAQITKLVRAVSVQAKQIRPEIEISAAVFSDWSQTRLSIGQDWVEWLEEGYLDFVCPMDYIPDTARFKDMVRRQVDWVGGRVPLYVGIGAFLLPGIEELIGQIGWTREAGADGFILFQYDTRVGEEWLPLLKLGVTAEETYPPHGGPEVWFPTPEADFSGMEPGERFYKVGKELALAAQFVEGMQARRVKGRVELCELGEGECQSLGELRGGEGLMQSRVTPAAGDYRLVAEGEYRDGRGKKRAFTRRGAVLRVRDQAFVDSLRQLYAAPVPTGHGVPVGVLVDGYGGEPLLRLLEEREGLEAFPVRYPTPEILAATRVLILPQPRKRSLMDRATRTALREWVEGGGRLLVTHDMAGMRGLLSIVPEVCARGTGFPRSVEWRVTGEHPAVAGLPTGMQTHAYYDHIALEPGEVGQVLAVDGEERPVLVVGPHGEGRYAALGLIPGLAPGDVEVMPAGAERKLVESLVGWLVEGL